jgi:Polysaccharide pyruvyl transferase
MFRFHLPTAFGASARPQTRFGLLSYSTDNLGDDIQSIAARKFLPKVDQYFDREQLDEAETPDGKPIKLIMNGWFCHRPEKWPPAPIIDPLLISVHITNNSEPGSGVRAREEFSRMPEALNYLRLHGPVGARDEFTLDWLKSVHVECYYSGCLTLTLDRPAVGREPFIVANDLPAQFIARAQTVTSRPIIQTTHMERPTSLESRFDRANRLIELYARASCVLTSRLHGALPCLAIGTPVLLIESSWDSSRFTGLRDLVHHCSGDDFLSGRVAYDLNEPPNNPSRQLQLREQLENRVASFIGSDTTPNEGLITRMSAFLSRWPKGGKDR